MHFLTVKICMSTADILTVTGLILDAVGIVLLFRYAPEKFPDPQSTVFFAIKDDSRDEWKKQQSKRKNVANFSLCIIVVGFSLQAIAVIFW